MAAPNVTLGPAPAPAPTEPGEAGSQLRSMVVDGLGLFSLALLSLLVAKVVRDGKVRLFAVSEARREVVLMSLEIATWTFLWFALSVSLVVYNKWLLHSWEGGFDFPLTISMIHMVLKYVLSLVVVRGTSLRHALPDIPSRVWWFSAVPVGIGTALDVAASNASFLYVTVTFYTIVKSTSLIFTLFFSILYRLQPCSLSLIGSVIVIGAGVAMASYGESEFSWVGFGLILGASAVGGYRWSLTQVLMKQIHCSLNAILTIYLISPASALSLVPMTLWLEGSRWLNSKFVTDTNLFMLSMLNIFGAGLVAFAMIFVELELLRRTSSMTLGVISYIKQIWQIGLSMLVFHDSLTLLNVLGFFLTLLGMFCYSYIKNPARSSTHIRHAHSRNDGLFVFDDFADDELDDGFAMDMQIRDLDEALYVSSTSPSMSGRTPTRRVSGGANIMPSSDGEA